MWILSKKLSPDLMLSAFFASCFVLNLYLFISHIFLFPFPLSFFLIFFFSHSSWINLKLTITRPLNVNNLELVSDISYFQSFAASHFYPQFLSQMFWFCHLIMAPTEIPSKSCTQAGVAASLFCMTALQRKSYWCIPGKGIVRLQSQFPHACVCERFINSQDLSTYVTAAE